MNSRTGAIQSEREVHDKLEPTKARLNSILSFLRAGNGRHRHGPVRLGHGKSRSSTEEEVP